jgi:WD40 repeat protein
MSAVRNPFPGPQPYRASDRERFYGRDDLSYKLEGSILANRCVTVYGPSGAGKSSLVQASVIPGLVESQDIRAVRVDSWPDGEDPTRWLADAVYSDLKLGERPDDMAPDEAVLAAAQRAARRSPRLVVVYLDQMEQLLYSNRLAAECDALFDCVNRLVDMPLRNLRVVLSLREDYLGRFRDRLRDRRRLLDNGFRVGPLTVAEICDAVCKAAAAGEPPQSWSPEEMLKLMLQVRVPGQAESEEAEAQAAYAQIVCRALFQERASESEASKREADTEAEPILRRYLEATLHSLGPLREPAERLLEDHLITADGSRTVRTEKELAKVAAAEKLQAILRALEGAAILHAEEHQGSRYFELGHDWLAKKVFEARSARELEEEQRRALEEQQRALEQQRAETEARLAKARAERRSLQRVAVVSLAVAAAMVVIGAWAWTKKTEADAQRRRADDATKEALVKQQEAEDSRLIAGFRELSARGQLAYAMKLLWEVKKPEERRGWVELASESLRRNALRFTLIGHEGPLYTAAWSSDGTRILTASFDETARVWTADGKGSPVVLKGHDEPVTSAAWSSDNKKILTSSEDGTARIWSADGAGEPLVLKGHEGSVLFAAWSPDNTRVVTVSTDKTARIFAADGRGEPVVLLGHEGAVARAAWSRDGAAVFTASEDGTVRRWLGGAAPDKPVVFKGHTGAVVFLALSPDGNRLLSASKDATARIWDQSGKGKPIVLRGHAGDVYYAAWSPDGASVATASADRTARVFSADGEGEPVVLKGHELSVGFVAWSPDGKYISTASSDKTARLWAADGSGEPIVLQGHEVPVRSAAWSPDGKRVLTAAWDPSVRYSDYRAKVWSTEQLQAVRPARRGAGFFHTADLSDDGKHVISAYDDKAARLWHFEGAEEPIVLQGHDAWVSSAAMSPDKKKVATASFDKTARVYSADGKGEPVVLRGHEAELRDVAFSPDGARVVTASEDRTARVFQADGGGTPIVLKGHRDWLSSAAWSPDGSRIVTTSWDRTARVFRADGSGSPVVLSGHGGEINMAAFSPDGQRVVTVSEDGLIRVFSADGTGNPVVLRLHEGGVLRAAWSTDGKRIASSSVDKTVCIFNADGTGLPIVLGTTSPIIALAFMGGGQELAAVAADNTPHTWLIDVFELKNRLSQAHADCLPPVVRALYLGEATPRAEARYAKCEREHQREPFLLEEQ